MLVVQLECEEVADFHALANEILYMVGCHGGLFIEIREWEVFCAEEEEALTKIKSQKRYHRYYQKYDP